MKGWLGLAASALAIALAAPVQAAPAASDPRPDPDACKLLTNGDLAPLLFDAAGGTLDSWSSHPAPGLSVCRWEARPRELPIDTRPRTANLSFYHIADPVRAQAQLDAQPKGDPSPSAALVEGDQDALVRPTPLVTVARHAADVALLDAGGAALNAPQQAQVRYLLDALALKAAGATVRPPPPSATNGPGDSGGTGATDGWTPPPHPVGPLGAALQPVLHVVHKLALWRFFVMPVFIVGGIALGSLWPKPAAPRRSAGRAIVPGVLIGLGVVNIVGGPNISSALIYRFGQSGSATITDSHGTSTQYNNHDVIGYDVLIRTAAGGVVKTGFQDDDFNIYPSHNAVSYPSENDTFTARYLPIFPKDFVIVADDASPWAKGLRCGALMHADTEARAKLGFAPADPAFRAAADRADATLKAAGCDPGG